MHRKFFLFIVFYILFRNVSLCQDVAYQFSQLNIYNGLSNNEVRCILKDKKGFFWFGTSAGLNRFDGVKFKVFRHSDKDTTSLYDDQILKIFEAPNSMLWIRTKFGYNIYDIKTETITRLTDRVAKDLGLPDLSFLDIKNDSNGNYWFVYPGNGVYCYNEKSKKTAHVFNSGKQSRLHSNSVAGLDVGSKGGEIWLIYRDGFIEQFTKTFSRVLFRSDKLQAHFKGITDLAVTVDNDGDPWFFCTISTLGLVFIDAKQYVFNYLSQNSDRCKLSSDIVRGVVQDNKGLVWIATDHGGVDLFSKKDFSIKYITNKEGDEKSLSQNSIIGIYKDNDGIIWLGTYKRGISFYHENIYRFPLYKRVYSDTHTLSFNDVNRFAEDDKGNLWIGTNGGGLLYLNRKTGNYTQYLHQKNNTNSISSDVVVCLMISQDKKLYIGTYLGGMDCFDGKNFTHFNTRNSRALGDDNIWEILEDNSRRILIGTIGNGVIAFDPEKKSFNKLIDSDSKSVRSGYVPTLFKDKDGNVWIGGYAGIDKLDVKTNRFIYFSHKDDVSNSLTNNNVNCITQDSRGWIWLGTRNGISISTNGSGNFINIHKEMGLPANAILDIIEDNNKDIWVSSLNGICLIKVLKKANKYSFEFQTFDEKDGLQGRVFNESAVAKLSSGELVFGGANGFNLFKPSNLHYYSEKPNLVLTGLQLFNKPIEVNEDINGRTLLSKSISDLKKLELKHDENFFTIEFAALNYFHPEKIKYQYMMEGLDHSWINAAESHQATYMHLNSGNYIFKVRAINGSNTTVRSLIIEIFPPFYRTTLAYFFYVCIGLGLLFYARRRGIQKIEAQFALAQERKEAESQLESQRKEALRLNELYMLKIKFFTNVSHEFRTPLSLILAPINKLMQSTDSTIEKAQINLLKRNADRLLNLVNQLLDFRKMEAKELELNVRQGDIILFIKDVCDSFKEIAEAKRIRFIFNSEVASFFTLFDHDKIERAILNLLSNAFKFTLDDGKICVFIDEVHNSNHVKERTLQIKVIDTGIGIPADKVAFVFDNFFQTKMPETILNQGSGIGLSIAKEFVEMHRGTITIDSKPKEGTCFTLEIPFPVLRVKQQHIQLPDENSADTENIKDNDKVKTKPLILLVEDNDDFRFYLKDTLTSYFSIIEAANGKEGWQKALSHHPDLVVSDISMPEMDGIELLKKIKADRRTNHIPVILLTALTGDQELLKGLETGANEYITKPFNFEVLVPKIKNLLKLQDSFKKTYSKQVNMNLGDIRVESENEKFLAGMISYIEKNIRNPQLSVEDLSKHMAMSRVSLYKRVLATTGKSPVDFIRSYRLKKAAQLLEKSQRNIAEIAYEVGFNTPNYFAKAFKHEFNMLPSEYISKYRNAEDFKLTQKNLS